MALPVSRMNLCRSLSAKISSSSQLSLTMAWFMSLIRQSRSNCVSLMVATSTSVASASSRSWTAGEPFLF